MFSVVVCSWDRKTSKVKMSSNYQKERKQKFICVQKLSGNKLGEPKDSSQSFVTIIPGEIFELICIIDDTEHHEQLSLISLDRSDILLNCSPADVREIGSFAAQLLAPVEDFHHRYLLLESGDLNEISTFETGSRVDVLTRHGWVPGTVRYIGQIFVDRDDWFFGVELDSGHIEYGDCDGRFKGKEYFRCRKNCGVFANAAKIRPVNGFQQNLPVVKGTQTACELERVLLNENWPTAVVVNGRQRSEPKCQKPMDGPVAATIFDHFPFRISQKLAYKGEPCTVRWLGKMSKESASLMVGIEYENQVGSGTGMYQGHQLFTCLPKHGDFIEMEKLTDDFYPSKAVNRQGLVSIQPMTGIQSQAKALPSYSEVAKKGGGIALRSPQEAVITPSSPVAYNRLAANFNSRQPMRADSKEHPQYHSTYQQDYGSQSGKMSYRSSSLLNQESKERAQPSSALSSDRLEIEKNAEYANGIVNKNIGVAPPAVHVIPIIQERAPRDCINAGLKIRPQEMANLPSMERHSSFPHLRVVDISEIGGKRRGIQGHQNSCYLDATLFGMFAFSNVFDDLLKRERRRGDPNGFEECQFVLREKIVAPLRNQMYVQADDVMELRNYIDRFSVMEGMTNQEKDPEEFLSSLFQQILCIDPLLKLTSGDVNWYTLFVEKNRKVPVPTIQNLFDESLIASDVRLKEVPKCLILQTPRSGSQYKMYKMVLPSSVLDITDAIIGYPRPCCICQDHAQVECKDCYGWITTGKENVSRLSSMKFCNACFAKRHRNLPEHKPVGIPPSNYGDRSDRVLMELFAVVCIKTSHYVSFAKDGSGMWYFTDSMADREGEGAKGYNIPEVKLCPEIADYLEAENGLESLMDLVERNETLNEPINRFFEDGYLCMYQPRSSGSVFAPAKQVQLINTSSSL